MLNQRLSINYKLLIWLIQFAAVLSLLIYNLSNHPLKINADLLSLFEVDTVDENDSITSHIEKNNLNKHIVLIGSKDIEQSILKASEFTDSLNKLPSIAEAVFKFPRTPSLDDISKSYITHRWNFLSLPYKKLLEQKEENEIFSYQFSLLNQIANPAISLTIKDDPTLSLADFFSRNSIANNGLTVYKDHLIAEYNQKQYVLVSFTPKENDLNINATQKLNQAIKNLTADATTEYLFTGSLFYTSEASEEGQSEMFVYGGISILATLMLIFFSYRSVTAIIATFTLIFISFLYGFLALNIFYQQLNIIALVFSVTLIGIAADYSFHALTEIKYSQKKLNIRSPLKKINSSLLMSFITTSAGYILLMLAPFILFQQIALFTLFGLFGALLTVLLCYPFLDQFIPFTNEVNHLGIINKVYKIQERLIGYVVRFWFLWLSLLVVSLFFISKNLKDENVRNYYQPDKNLKAMESKIKTILKASWENQYYLVKGKTPQEVLHQEEKLIKQLQPLLESKAIEKYSAITTWLPSIKTQQYNNNLVTDVNASGLFSKMKKSLTQANWNTESSFEPLTVEQWFATPLGRIFNSQWFYYEKHYYSYVRLSGITNLEALGAVSNSIDNLFFIDKAQTVSNKMQQFKGHLIRILAAAFFAAFLVFIFRYGLRKAIFGIITPLTSLILALILSYCFQQQLNIFNFIAGILILALGLDYSVFYAEHGFKRKITLTTLMSALSSTFVFAILILSSMPSIRSFGITVFIGISMTFLFSPLITLMKKHP